MKNILCLLLLAAVVPCFGSPAVKAKKAEHSVEPTPDMPGYANWDSWLYMTESTSASKYYVKRIIVPSPGVANFWLKIEERQPPECTDNTTSSSGAKINPFLESPLQSYNRERDAYNRERDKRACESQRREALGSTVMHIIFSCKNRKAKYLEQVTYNQAGESINSDDGKDKWVGIFPDTAMEGVFKSVCVGI